MMSTPAGYRQVTKGEFFKAMNPLDVHPWPEGRSPFLMRWKLRDGRTVALSQCIPAVDGGGSLYYLPGVAS